MGASIGTTAVFAYGTLKQGFQNHAAYCAGFTEVRPGWAWGRLYRWRAGIPILQVPDETILLMGSRDVEGDLQASCSLVPGSRAPARGNPGRRSWRRIRGELLLFPDGVQRLRLLDAFEGFHPSPGARTYERVLLPVEVGSGADRELRTAWAYVLPPDRPPPAEDLPADVWHPGTA